MEGSHVPKRHRTAPQKVLPNNAAAPASLFLFGTDLRRRKDEAPRISRPQNRP